MNKQSFVNYTKEVWQPHYKEELSDLDAIEIANNMTEYMNLLIQWDKEDQEAEKHNLARLSVVDNNKKEIKR